MLDMQINDAKKLLVEAGKELLAKKLVVSSWGNISLKIEKDCFAITPSGGNYGQMNIDDIVIINADGKKMAGNKTPSTEKKMHMAIYKAHPDFRAIVHTHSTYASAVAAMRRPIPPLLDDMAHISNGPINVANYALSGSDELAKNAVEALGSGKAVLLANHGVVCCGSSLPEAMMIADLVEKSAQIYCITASMGGAYVIDRKYVEEIASFYNNHYSKRQEGME